MQHATTGRIAECERIVVTAATGKVYDLGKPNSIWFPVRVWFYKLLRKIHG